jgi:hypothetical protein
MSEPRSVSGGTRRTGGRRARSGPSAGLPSGDLPPAEERIAELESRLARLEGGAGLRERGRHMLDRVMPPDASRHFRNAGREELLGIRSIVDFWIRRIDDAEDRAASPTSTRESIEVE